MGFFSNLLNYRCPDCGSKNTRIHRSTKVYTSFHCNDCGRGNYKVDSSYYAIQCQRCGCTSQTLMRVRFSDEKEQKWTLRCDGCGGWMR